MIKRIKSKLLRIITRIILVILALLTAFVLIVFIGGWNARVNTSTEPFMDNEGNEVEGSVAQYERLNIGGVTQSV